MLSVIVPVYNGEKYIDKCIESIQKQTYGDIEIVCVNDGSTDNSLQLLCDYAQKDKRIRIINKETNEGLVAARISGISEANGEYIAYVDCDDWIDSNMFADMIEVALSSDADMVTSGTIYEGKINKTTFDGFEEGIYEGKSLEDLKNHVFYSNTKYTEGIRSNLVNKIYKRDLILQAQRSIPDIVSYGEDRICTLRCILGSKSVYVLHKAYYHYVVRDNSMSSGNNPFFLDQVGILHRELLSVISGTENEEELRVQCGFYVTQLLLKGINDNLGIEPRDMMWIHPHWVSQIPANSKIVLYGCGRRGRIYYNHIINDNKRNIEITAWVDKNYEKLQDFPIKILDPQTITMMDFDYIVVTIENDKIYFEIEEWLKSVGVDSNKILRPMPLDSFWEFAESAGLYTR